MDLTPPEQPKPPEGLTQEGILVPKKIIRPFARGLFQLSSEPIQKIKEMLSVEFAGTDLEKKQIDEMRQALDEITTTLALLRTAKEVKITQPTEKQYKLTFSPETEEEEIPREGEISIKESLTHPLIIAVFDRLGLDSSRVQGYAQLLASRSGSEQIKREMEKVYSTTLSLGNSWKLLQEDNYQLKISTDGEGNTTLTPIPRPTPQP